MLFRSGQWAITNCASSTVEPKRCCTCLTHEGFRLHTAWSVLRRHPVIDTTYLSFGRPWWARRFVNPAEPAAVALHQRFLVTVDRPA